MRLSIRFCCPVNTFRALRNNSSSSSSHTPIMSSLRVVCVRLLVSFSLCFYISSSAEFFRPTPVYLSFSSFGCVRPWGLPTSRRVMAGEIGVPWARSDTMYGIVQAVCIALAAAVSVFSHRHGWHKNTTHWVSLFAHLLTRSQDATLESISVFHPENAIIVGLKRIKAV